MDQESSTDTYFNKLRNLNVGLGSAITEKNRAKQYFVEAFTLLKNFNNTYNYKQLSQIFTSKFDPDPDNPNPTQNNLNNINNNNNNNINNNQNSNNVNYNYTNQNVNLNINQSDNYISQNQNNEKQINAPNFPNFRNKNNNNNNCKKNNFQQQEMSPQLKNLLNDKVALQNFAYFNMEVNLLIRNISVYYEHYKNTSDMLKGLVFISAFIIHMDKNFTPHFAKFLPILAFFYAAFDCEETNYKTLALIAQILDFQAKNSAKNNENAFFQPNRYSNQFYQNSNNNYNSQKVDFASPADSEDSHSNSTQDCLPSPKNNAKSLFFSQKNNNNNPNYRNSGHDNFEWMNKKSFVQKIFQIDVEEQENDKKKAEILKMLGVILPYFARNSEKIREFRQLNQFKVFLLQNIRFAFDLQQQKVVGELVYALCKIVDQSKFNEKEILKFRTIETLIQLIESQQSHLLLFGAFKLLKVFWRSSIRRLAMIKQQLPQKLLSIYSTQPRLILTFIEEIFNSEQQILLKEFPGLFNALLSIVYKTQSKPQYKEENQQILRFLVKIMTKEQFDQVLQRLGQGLFSQLLKQYEQIPCDVRIQQTILTILYSISQKFSPLQILSINPQDPTILQNLLAMILSQLQSHLQKYLNQTQNQEQQEQNQKQQLLQQQSQNQNQDQDLNQNLNLKQEFVLQKIPSENNNLKSLHCKQEFAQVKLEECDAV
ncbi:hypothetical protein PPERSA_11059 [Pseudocohnilembus persalinus]|uniref:Uncharacterized protein n=1 Tax=Pseudocohnilembus persalinus TaxID=266149 RepID=A0A0V0QZ24_PSEPJ|nr:hypothetical protein PPERSA_11059 [Pseudocohnilembus persalinus]|eukprot:KRX07510.1 hypothetical protein PPERSA_11059 [Pseudocohnilembus persalinus]